MSSIPLIEILQNCFFQLYNCNNNTAINVHMDSQDNLNMAKASNFTENRRNHKIHTKPDDWILETALKWVSSVTDMNVLLSQKNTSVFELPTLLVASTKTIGSKIIKPSSSYKIVKKRTHCFAWRFYCCRFPQIPQHLV